MTGEVTAGPATAGESEPPSAGHNARGLFDGFEGYRSATEADYTEVLLHGLVAPDTNVLLNLYRYNPQARADLLSALARLGERLWVPHQVASEFWRNREAAIRDPEDAAERALDTIDKHRSGAIQALRTWANRVALEPGRLAEVQAAVEAGFTAIETEINAAIDAEATDQALNTNTDAVLASLIELLAAKVGDPIGVEEVDTVYALGRNRLAKGIPSGFMDAGKGKGDEEPDAALGDFLVWEQLLREATARRVNVLLITGDVKDDWWRRVQGETRGPRPELVTEMQARASVRLFMARPETFLAHARRALAVEVQDESLKDVERVERFAATRDGGGWTVTGAQLLMNRLDAEGKVQGAAIRQAVANGGLVTREQVYELGGYQEGRTLRGFTRPANRIAQELRASALVSEAAPDPLEAFYDPAFSWVQARGFRVPPQLLEILQTGLPEPEGS